VCKSHGQARASLERSSIDPKDDYLRSSATTFSRPSFCGLRMA
jgi:hypothetical protein